MKTKLLLVLSLFTFQLNAQCWSKIESGAYHTIAIAHNGTLWSWGYNNSGQLGNGTTNNSAQPVQIGTSTNWVSIGAGYYHSLGIKSDGTLWAWGYNNLRQLGNNSTNNSLVPIQIGSDTNWSKVSGGESFSVALKTDGTMWTWGSDDQGQMGGGLSMTYVVPTKLGVATDWIDVDAGRHHVIALKSSNKIYTWGFNGNGQIGNLSSSSIQATPYLVVSTGTAKFIKVEAGVNSSLAIKDDNTLWICGLVYPSNTNFFQQFASPSTWSSVKAGLNHVVGVKSDGTLWAWGDNSYGQISQSGLNSASIPFQISGTNYSANIGVNLYSSLIIKNDGSLYGTGQNHVGQLGDNNLFQKNTIASIACPTTLGTASFIDSTIVSLFPNPVLNTLNISVGGNSEIQNSAIYDGTGKLIKNQNSNATSINVEDLASGLYFLQVVVEGKAEVKKFVKD